MDTEFLYKEALLGLEEARSTPLNEFVMLPDNVRTSSELRINSTNHDINKTIARSFSIPTEDMAHGTFVPLPP